MLYNVAQLLKAPVGADMRGPIDDAVDLESDEAALIGSVSGDVRLQRTNQGVLATGACEATIRLECVRCLEPFDLPLHVDFAEMFQPTIDVVTGQALPHIDEDQAFPIDARHHLDLSEAIRQQVILALPMQPVCRPDCAGLCSICGGNRNLRHCDCEARDDARWSALAHLTLDLPEES